MPWTTTINAETGETKRFFLDASFGCAKTTTTHAGPAHPIYEVKWSRERSGPSDQSRKFLRMETASNFFTSKQKKHARPEWLIHRSCTHEAA